MYSKIGMSVSRVFLLTSCLLKDNPGTQTVPASAGVVQAGGDSVDGGAQGVVQVGRIVPALLALQQFHLNQTHGIDVRVAKFDGSREYGIPIEHPLLLFHQQHHSAAALELIPNHLPEASPHHASLHHPTLKHANPTIAH